MESNNINTDYILKDILKKSTKPEPSEDFTNNVMILISELKPDWVLENKPLISRKVWFFIGFFVVMSLALILIVASLSSGEGTKQFTFAHEYEIITNNIGFQLKSFFSSLKIPLLIPLGLGFVFFALLIEQFFRKIFKIKNIA